jgi:hypothetical protein
MRLTRNSAMQRKRDLGSNKRENEGQSLFSVQR